jgi:PhnB protein
MRFRNAPEAAQGLPDTWLDKVLYGALHSPFGDVAAMDAPPGRAGEPGDNFAISISLDDETRAAAIFTKLADGGKVMMPFEKTFFATKFGMTADKFGIKWMVNVSPPRA